MNTTKKGEKKQRIGIYDLEVTAHEGSFWGKSWETNIIETHHYGKILSFSWKWLGGKKITRGWCDYRNKEEGLIKDLWKLLDEADIVIGHNSKSFDDKWAKTRFLHYGLPIPRPWKNVDTKTESKKHLYLPSYSLNNISDYFGFGSKLEHEGWPLWKRCIKGDKRAWAKMLKYNSQDVSLTEKLYLKLRPLIDIKGVFFAYDCPKCGGEIQGRGFTADHRKRRGVCKRCGGWTTIKK